MKQFDAILGHTPDQKAPKRESDLIFADGRDDELKAEVVNQTDKLPQPETIKTPVFIGGNLIVLPEVRQCVYGRYSRKSCMKN